MPRFRKVKISSNNPERRVGAAFALIGFIGLYAFLLYVWAGNPPDLIALAMILLLIIVGLGMHRRAKASAPRPTPGPGLRAALKLPRFKRKRKPAAQEAEEEEPAAPPPREKKGLAARFRRG